MNISIKYFSDDPNRATEGMIRSLERGEKVVYDKDNRSFAHLSEKDFDNLEESKKGDHYVSKIPDLKKYAEKFIQENQIAPYLSKKLMAALENPGKPEDKELSIHYLSNHPSTFYSEIIEALSEGERIIYDTGTNGFARANQKEFSKIQDFESKLGRGPNYSRFTAEIVIIESLLEAFIEKHGIEPTMRENLEKAFRMRADEIEKETFFMTDSTKRKIAALKEMSAIVYKAAGVANKTLRDLKPSD